MTVILLSITDEVTTCDCCGKTNLKRVAVLQLADGSIVHYGRDCAARKLGKSFGKSIDAKVSEMETFAKIREYIARFEGKYTPAQICNGIAGRFGYMLQFKNGQYMTYCGPL